MSTDELSPATFGSRFAAIRLLIGLAQGAMLWVLFHAAETHSWPSTNLNVFGPALLIGLFLPIAAVTTIGSLRPSTLACWLIGAALFVGFLGLHEVARGSMQLHQAAAGSATANDFDPRPQIFPAAALALFIAQSLIVAADAERRLIASYRAYFDIAWKQEVQLLLAVLFLGLFWGVLWLGAGLFDLIGIDALKKLLTHSSFAIPASTLAVAVALHLTDIRAGLVQGMRNLLHMLLSWLLPLAALLIVAFIATLPFTGLAPLWRTSHGAEIVLAAAAVLIVLINTAYRDGTIAILPSPLRWAGSAAALCLPVLVAISAYGLTLRIGQRGWTEARVIAVACTVIGGLYAVGYASGTVASVRWLKRLEATNIATAGLIVAVIVALTTIADPARLAVADQVARLAAGRVTPAEFDFKYLRFDSGRYGRAALEQLKDASWTNPDVKREAARALALANRYETQPPDQAQLARIPVYPTGHTLPQHFLDQNWATVERPYDLPRCLTNSSEPCEAYITGARDGPAMIIVAGTAKWSSGVAFTANADGVWQPIGSISNVFTCDSVRQAMRRGEYRWVAPRQMDLEVAGQRLTLSPTQRGFDCR